MTPLESQLQKPEDAAGLPQSSGELAHMERALIQQVLDKNGGNIAQAARELHISRATLYRKLKKVICFILRQCIVSNEYT